MTRQHKRCHNTGMVKTALILAATLLLTGCSTTQPNQTPTLPTEFGGTGTFVAGEDIAPGYYEQPEPADNCAYAVQNEDGKTIAFNGGSAILIVSEGDTVTLEDCNTYEWFQNT